MKFFLLKTSFSNYRPTYFNPMEDVLLPKKATTHQFTQEEIILNDNRENLPIWIIFEGRIILDVFRSISNLAVDFLTAVAEPLSRPIKIHDYQIAAYFLYAAAPDGITTVHMPEALNEFSKNYIPKSVSSFITDCALSYGKIRLFRTHTKFLIEAISKDTLELLQ